MKFLFQSIAPVLSFCCLCLISNPSVSAQTQTDTIRLKNLNELNHYVMPSDSTKSVVLKKEKKKAPIPTQKNWIPNPAKAAWMAAIIPGGGQIYNRKYWKLPIIYGGFVGCAYALTWNSNMYADYKQAYIDIMDNNPSTKSYMDYLPVGYDITGQEEQYKQIFKKRKDFYRRNRDLSIFAFVGVYLLSVIDAYVDAELSNFDISKDLGLRIEPTIMNENKSIGMQCSITF